MSFEETHEIEDACAAILRDVGNTLLERSYWHELNRRTQIDTRMAFIWTILLVEFSGVSYLFKNLGSLWETPFLYSLTFSLLHIAATLLGGAIYRLVQASQEKGYRYARTPQVLMEMARETFEVLEHRQPFDSPVTRESMARRHVIRELEQSLRDCTDANFRVNALRFENLNQSAKYLTHAMVYLLVNLTLFSLLHR